MLRLSSPFTRLAVLATLVCACEEVPTPSPTQVCLDRSSADRADLCDTAVCVEKEHPVTLDNKSGLGFTLTQSCPTAEQVAQSGWTLDQYSLGYTISEPSSGMALDLGFSGQLCAEPMTAASLQKYVTGGYLRSSVVPLANGLGGSAKAYLQASDLTFVPTDAGRAHLRLKASFSRVTYYTPEPLCVVSSGIPLPRGCTCEYASAGVADMYTYALDYNVPFPSYGP